MSSNDLTLGVIGTSSKENEFRIPIHPAHFGRIAPALRQRIFVEHGYSQATGFDDEALRAQFAGVMSREQLFEQCDIILLPKPTPDDFDHFREGQILWGWPHCIQGEAITQVGIDKHMTYIAWEAMFLWRKETRDLHIFHKNNEMAGYCSVLHGLQLAGITGYYGPPRSAAVISFGSTGRGAIHALRGSGYTDITLLTQRPYYAVQAPIPSIGHRRYQRATRKGDQALVRIKRKTWLPMVEELARHDIIVNCILQDTDRPLTFIKQDEIERLKPNTLIVDVSCDTAMGFEFARPTSFEDPNFVVSDNIVYYAVDHTPSYLWRAASFEISAAVVSFLETVMDGEQAWAQNETIQKAIEIKDGVVLNPKILRFQKRADSYPHPKQTA